MTSYRVTYPSGAIRTLPHVAYQYALDAAQKAMHEDDSHMPVDTSSRRRKLAEFKRFKRDVWQALNNAEVLEDQEEKCGKPYTEYTGGTSFSWTCECNPHHDDDCSPFSYR